ncbi:pyruvate dehydrogenase E1 component subunit alpha, somatic form, mitochondrial-like [Phymastichus coffea]|uniref:pyruvate dehydrogenase E1 component subunit alpha, somatic form, mitochondrial-like n=1 Tax=Phymastichus coffea TaxID=108790 RepID=UPI00273AD72B|nr:pyruvate dehydrogenase E1 component subunit alpha, somatic form, mitochondrial-like [Phymastichus coffea]
MFYIRRMENKAAELYRARLINGFCHLYSGQEAVAVGLKAAMKENDTIITAYRCHAFAKMFGYTPRQIIAELMGRKTGASEGKGGSMHMYATNFYGGEGIVGGQVPLGAGIGFAHKYNGNGAVSFALYGDGAASQGQIFESYNMSQLWSLPVIFVCENNKYGMGTAIHRHSANDKFYTRGDLIPGIQVNGMKVEEVREAVKFAREYAVSNGPMLMEMQTYRYYGHSMSDPGTSYRTREEVKTMKDQSDAIKHFTTLCEEKGLLSKEEIEEMRKKIFKDVDQQVEEAKKDEWPDKSAICSHLYVNRLEETRGMVPWHKV